MLNLLKLEYYKFKNNAAIQFLLILFVILFPFLILAGKELFVNVPPPLPSSAVFYEFPTVWEYQGYVGSWLIFFFLGFVAITMVTSEITYKTLRQNIISGLTRKEYFAGKVITILAISIIATVMYTITCVIIGLFHTPGADLALIFDNNWSSLKFFLMSFGYLSFGLMIGFVVRKSGLSTFLYLAYIMFLEPIIKWAIFGFLNWDIIQGAVESGVEDQTISLYNFVNYLPMNLLEDLHPLPLLKLPDTFMNDFDEIDYDVLLSQEAAMTGAVLYSCLFIFIAYRSFIKRDI